MMAGRSITHARSHLNAEQVRQLIVYCDSDSDGRYVEDSEDSSSESSEDNCMNTRRNSKQCRGNTIMLS